MAKHEGKEIKYDGMAPVPTVKRIAFDVDGTLIRRTDNGDVPRYDVIETLKFFVACGHSVFVWSGGGEDYARMWAQKLDLLPSVRIVGKTASLGMDLAFDDHATSLALVDIIV